MPELTVSAPAPSPTTAVMNNIGGAFTPHFADIPVDVYNFLNVMPGMVDSKDLSDMKQIAEWAFSDGATLGEGMDRMRQLEIKLGSARLGDNRLNKISNWVKIENSIKDLRLRQGAI